MTRSFPIALWAVAGVFAFAVAQTPPRATPVPDAAVQVPKSYRLKPNDGIELSVFGEPDLAQTTRILKTGEAVFPLLGAVPIAGLTLAEATERIRGAYDADYLVDPKVELTVMDYAIETVSVIGAVNGPGQIPIPASGRMDLATALAAAGGLSPGADADRITLIRAAGDRSTHTRAAVEAGGGPIVAAGDRVVVLESRFLGKSVTILGQVRTPREIGFPLDGKLDLLTAISRAGGFSELANRKKVTVSRDGVDALLDVREGNEQRAQQFLLKPGDIVTVAERVF